MFLLSWLAVLQSLFLVISLTSLILLLIFAELIVLLLFLSFCSYNGSSDYPQTKKPLDIHLNSLFYLSQGTRKGMRNHRKNYSLVEW